MFIPFSFLHWVCMSCLSRALPVPTMLWLHRLSDVNGVWHCITTVSLYRLRTSRLEVASIFRRLFVPFTLFRWPCGPCVSRAPHVSSVLRLRRQGDGYNMCRCTATFVLRFVRIRRFHIISSLCLLSVPFSCLPWTCGSRSSKALPVLTVLWMHRRGDVSSLRHRVTSFALCRSRTRCLHVGVFLCLLFIRSTLLRRTCGPNSSRALHVLAVPCLPLQGQGDVGNMRRCVSSCVTSCLRTRGLLKVRLKLVSPRIICVFRSALCRTVLRMHQRNGVNSTWYCVTTCAPCRL